MAQVISTETVNHTRTDGPTLSVDTIREERVESGGLITLVPSHLERRVINPETLPSGPKPRPRRRARR